MWLIRRGVTPSPLLTFLVSLSLLCLYMTTVSQGADRVFPTLQNEELSVLPLLASDSEVGPASPPPKVAVVTVIAFTFCKDFAKAEKKYALEGPIVLAESVRRFHPDVTLIAIAHSSSKDLPCGVQSLEKFGYEMHYHDLPVAAEDIENEDYVRIAKYERQGCCGLREFLKLYCYTLTDYDVVIHLDLDMLLMKPMDDLINVMLGRELTKPIPTYRNEPVPTSGVDFLYTRDYKGGKDLPHRNVQKMAVQGGFFMIRPSMEVFEDMKSIVRRGNFSVEQGWEGSGIGDFHGDARIQGFLSYYYYARSSLTTLEVDRCIYNTVMEDATMRFDNGTATCLTNEKTCQDCRLTPFGDLVLVHYTMCQKPWTCQLPTFLPGRHALCRQAHTEWFRLRHTIDERLNRTLPPIGGVKATYGYCSKYGFFDATKHAYLGAGLPISLA